MRPPFTIIDDEEEAPREPIAVDPSLADAAIARIRKQVQGNGLRPSSIELRSVVGQVHVFYGTTSVQLVPGVQESKRAGRFNDGEIIQPQQIAGAIDNFITRVSADRGVLGLVHETILARPDQGFGASGETIPLPQVSRSFVAHEACAKCRGAGGTPCHNCHGQMRVTCYRCHGAGGVNCITCQGRGQILTPQGPVICHACQGRGLSPCPVCQGQRMITCPECQGHGKKICDACAGHGWTTHSWTVNLTAQTSFRLRTKGLPPALVSLIDRVGAMRLAADRHANVTPIMGREAEAFAAEADITQTASLWFLYRAEMPFAELEIAMGKSSIKPKLAGYKARLVDVPEFMDVLLRPGAQILAEAAAGGAGSAQKILDSARYRALGDVMRGLIRHAPRRVLKTLTDAYPLGLSENFARKVLKDGGQALSRLSLWPRTVAMLASLAVSLCVCAGFYLYGGRHSIVEGLVGQPAMLIYLADILLVLLLGIGGTYAIRATARRSLKSVLEGLGVVSGGRMPLPRPGVPGLWLWIGTLAIALTFAFFAGLIQS